MNKFTVSENTVNERIDSVLAEYIDNESRSGIKNRIETIKVNGSDAKLSKKVSHGDIIEYELKKEIEVNIMPENVYLDIIYEDENVFVINKPTGMVVHPAAGNYTGTMAQGILYRLNSEKTGFEEGNIRPGIVHRLDKETSGIIIAAKNSESLNYLSAQFKDRKTSKTYLALINGKLPEKKGEIKTLIGRDPANRKRMTWKVSRGKEAETHYRVLKQWDDKSFVALDLKTGRTHQLRVHMLSMNAPIIGDTVYSRKKSDSAMMLHAYRLEIRLPGEKSPREFRAPLPERFKKLMMNL